MTVSADLPEKKTRRLLAVPSLKWQNWLLLGIKLAMGLLLILLIMLYFVLRRDEADEQRSTMIADVLWLEQSASQYIKRSTEQLELLASDLAQERRKKIFFSAADGLSAAQQCGYSLYRLAGCERSYVDF